MSRIESGFIPLPKVESGRTSDKAYFKLNLPQFVDQDFRISAFPSWFPALDRAVALQILTRTQKLVADLHPEKK